LLIQTASGEIIERISPWASYVQQNKTTKLYESIFWNPPKPFIASYPRPTKPQGLRIYECHIGIASEEYGVASFKNFKDNVLPYIQEVG